MKIKINKIGGPFQHSASSHPWDLPDYVEWVTDNSASVSIHMDEAIFQEPKNGAINYAWLVESSAIIPQIIEHLKLNIGLIESRFEAIFTHDRRLLEFSDKFRWSPQTSRTWIKEKNIKRKTKLISMIASRKVMCPGHQLRQQVIEHFQGKIDHFGSGFKNIATKEEGLSDYCFSIAMENDNYPSNISEKIVDCFATGTIPVYWGPDTVVDHFNPEGIIKLDNNFALEQLSPDYYISKFDAVKDNYLRAMEIPLIEDYLYLNYIRNRVN